MRQALNACPRLWPHEARAHADLIERCATRLASTRPDLSYEQALAIADVSVTGALSVIELVTTFDIPTPVLMGELHRWLVGYVSGYLTNELGPRVHPPLDDLGDVPPSPLPLHHLRREPVQKRAIEAVESILDATMELLGEVGYEGLTTALVAERADVNIATVYRYFEDKSSLVKTLADRYLVKRDFMELVEPDPDGTWPEWRSFLIGRLTNVAGRASVRSKVVTLYRALQAEPELNAIRLSFPSSRGLIIADYLQWLRPSMDREQAVATGAICAAVPFSVMLRLDGQPDQAGALIGEVGLSMQRFIAEVVE